MRIEIGRWFRSATERDLDRRLAERRTQRRAYADAQNRTRGDREAARLRALREAFEARA